MKGLIAILGAYILWINIRKKKEPVREFLSGVNDPHAEHTHLWKDDSGKMRETSPAIPVMKKGRVVGHIHADYKEEPEGPKTGLGKEIKNHVHYTSMNKKTSRSKYHESSKA